MKSPSSDIAAILEFVSVDLLGRTPEREITADTELLAGGLVDSLGVMQLVDFLERRFEVTVPPGDVTIEHFMSARAIAVYIDTLRGGHDSAGDA